MSVEITTLSNGLRVISHRMSHLETVSLGVWVGSGARSEPIVNNGISHFLEHMAFKGTERRSSRQIVEEIETVGGDINAGTSLETTAYYARVLKEDLGLAIDILSDILQNSTFHGHELSRERDVILQEIAAANDSPDDVVYDFVQAKAFPDQGVGRPILGTAQSIAEISRDRLTQHLATHYRAGDMVLSAAGRLEHDQLVRHAEALFAGLNSGHGPNTVAARYVGGLSAQLRRFEQAHVVLAFPAPSYRDDEFYAAQVFSGLLGGGMSSRLFQEVRERRGLCYSIYSFCWGLSDTGLFGVHAATSQELVQDLRDVIFSELRLIAADGPSEEELKRSKAQLRAGLAMSLESSGARAEQMARQILAYDRTLSIDELIGKVEAIEREHIRAIAERFVECDRPTWSQVGSGGLLTDYDEMIASLSNAGPQV